MLPYKTNSSFHRRGGFHIRSQNKQFYLNNKWRFYCKFRCKRTVEDACPYKTNSSFHRRGGFHIRPQKRGILSQQQIRILLQFRCKREARRLPYKINFKFSLVGEGSPLPKKQTISSQQITEIRLQTSLFYLYTWLRHLMRLLKKAPQNFFARF